MNQLKFIISLLASALLALAMVVVVLAVLVCAPNAKAVDNDALAWEFVESEPEVMAVAYECYTEGLISDSEYHATRVKSLINVVLDPRDYCDSLKVELKELNQ